MTSARRQRPELGDLSQFASGRRVRLSDGSEDGLRAVDVRVAGGLHALVLTDRGMDIGQAWCAGYPLAWQSPTGAVHPSYFRDDVWLRSFHGGLLFTAGLQNVGNPVMDEGEQHGLHGRISNIPARDVSVTTIEDERGLAVEVRGSVRETSVYGVDLLLRRTLRFPVGEPLVELHDEVENLGFTPAPVYLLYHVNLGYPVVAEGARLIAPPATVEGWDEVSRTAEPDHAAFVAPQAGFPVQVFEHRLPASAPDSVTVGIVNAGYRESDGIGVTVTYDRRQLPRLWQWRNLGEGLYVTALEPSNCGLLGRIEEGASGNTATLAPGASLAFDVAIRAAVGPAVAALGAPAAAGATPPSHTAAPAMAASNR